MIRNCLHCAKELEDNSDGDPTKEIQRFLIKQLKLTPRRQLFEEYERTSTIVRSEEVDNQTSTNAEATEPTFKYELNNLRELNEFRQKHSKECMSDINRQRHRRAKEKEEEFLRHNRARQLAMNDQSLPSLINESARLFYESTRKESSTVSLNSTEEEQRFRTRSFRFAPDKSLALSYQKFKLPK